MVNYARIFSLRRTPQSEPIAGTVANSAGGYAFPVDDWIRLDRFLVLGSEGGSYYAGERALTRENAEAVIRCIAADGARAVARIVEISEAGRAPKNDPAIFALALATALGDEATKRAALAALPKVARTGTHLFQFAEAVQAMSRLGAWAAPGDRRLVSRASGGRARLSGDQVPAARGLVASRPAAPGAPADRRAGPRRELFDWVCRGTLDDRLARDRRRRWRWARPRTGEAAAALIRAHDLPREAVPTALLNETVVWQALLERMPMTALVRSLAKLTAVDVLKPFGEGLPLVLSAFGDAERIRRARLHPLAILLGLSAYAQGRGDKGSLAWEPLPQVVDALNAAFYTAFDAIEPTGKRLLLALDVSGSMGGGRVAGTALTPREASAAMALTTAATEASTHIVGFAAADGRDWQAGSVHDAAAAVALDAARRCGRRRHGPALRAHRLRPADALRAGEGAGGGCLRHLHRQRDLGRRDPSGPGAARSIGARAGSRPSSWWSGWCRTGSASPTRTMPACSTSSASTPPRRPPSPTSCGSKGEHPRLGARREGCSRFSPQQLPRPSSVDELDLVVFTPLPQTPAPRLSPGSHTTAAERLFGPPGP